MVKCVSHFAEVSKSFLMFLLNVLLDRTDELDVFCRLFEFFIALLLIIFFFSFILFLVNVYV